MKDTLASVVSITQIDGPYVRLHLKTGWDSFVPGQFVMIKSPTEEVFLRRPFGIVSITDGVAELCFKIVGKGTKALSRIKQSDQIFVLGPLGNGFVVPSETKTAMCVAGGYGIVPLLPLVRQIKKSGTDVVFYYGAKSSSDLLYIEEIKSSNISLKIATEDGSKGEKGLVTDLVKKDITSVDKPVLFASGPHGLLKEIALTAIRHNVPAQVSMDSYMACGMGVCLGCMVEDKEHKLHRACKDGPVFDAHKLKWE